MIHKSRCFLTLSLVILLSGSSTFSSDWDSNTAYAAAGLFAAGAIPYATEKIGDWVPLNEFGESIGVNPKDVGKVLGISTALLSLSFVTDGKRSEAFKKLALRAPLAATAAALTFSKTIQEILARIPLLGAYLKCENKACSGFCSECKITRMVSGIAMYKLVDYAMEHA